MAENPTVGMFVGARADPPAAPTGACLLCGHNAVHPTDGTCMANVQACSDESHNHWRRCGCKCRFRAALPVPGEADKVLVQQMIEDAFGTRGQSPIYQTAGRLIEDLEVKFTTALAQARSEGALAQRRSDADHIEAVVARLAEVGISELNWNELESIGPSIRAGVNHNG